MQEVEKNNQQTKSQVFEKTKQKAGNERGRRISISRRLRMPGLFWHAGILTDQSILFSSFVCIICLASLRAGFINQRYSLFEPRISKFRSHRISKDAESRADDGYVAVLADRKVSTSRSSLSSSFLAIEKSSQLGLAQRRQRRPTIAVGAVQTSVCIQIFKAGQETNNEET